MGQMTNKVYLATLWLLLIVGVEAQELNPVAGLTNQARIVCSEPNFDFGSVIGTNEMGHVFRLVNEGDVPLNITRIHTGCGCIEAKALSDTIPAHSSTELTVRFKMAGRVGPQQKIPLKNPDAL